MLRGHPPSAGRTRAGIPGIPQLEQDGPRYGPSDGPDGRSERRFSTVERAALVSTRVLKLRPPCLIWTDCRSHVFMRTPEGPCGPSVNFLWSLSDAFCFHLTLLETGTRPPGHVHTPSLHLPLIAPTLLNCLFVSSFVGWRVSQRSDETCVFGRHVDNLDGDTHSLLQRARNGVCVGFGSVCFLSQRLSTYQAAVIPNLALYLTSSPLPSLLSFSCMSLALHLCILAGF